MNITACWLPPHSPLQLARNRENERSRKKALGRAKKNFCEHKDGKYAVHHRVTHYGEGRTAIKTASQCTRKIHVVPLKKKTKKHAFAANQCDPKNLVIPSKFHQIRAMVSKISQFPQFQGQYRGRSYDLLMWLTGISNNPMPPPPSVYHTLTTTDRHQIFAASNDCFIRNAKALSAGTVSGWVRMKSLRGPAYNLIRFIGSSEKKCRAVDKKESCALECIANFGSRSC